MSLALLKNKQPSESLKILSAVSLSLLPNYDLENSHDELKNNSEISSVIAEIRNRLKYFF